MVVFELLLVFVLLDEEFEDEPEDVLLPLETVPFTLRT
ncbi:hypothetical protein CHCC14523_0302 [Bacillus paralicheniformis]|nr:hypothetical protein CHCC14523_0302 [Bacillus paralicheniformis]